MSDPIDDGGPAFPCQPLDGQGMPCNAAQDGMTLRDWFAGQALAALIARDDYDLPYDKIATSAYAYAKAMIKARKEGME